MKHNYVPDGCFLLARMIFDSAIWRDDPHVLKLFIYLVGKARYKTTPKKYPGCEVKQGELLTSLSNISEDNEYSENGRVKIWPRMKISRMLDLLETQGYIKKLCDTYGTHISICNYSLYQDMSNYKCDTDDTEVLQGCYAGDTQVLLNKKGKKGKKGKKEDKPEEMTEFLIPLKDGTDGAITTSFFDEMELAYVNVDVKSELAKARAWCISNPSKKKTARGLKQFVNGWLSRSNGSKAGSDMFGGIL
jgi:hypothetical protein